MESDIGKVRVGDIGGKRWRENDRGIRGKSQGWRESNGEGERVIWGKGRQEGGWGRGRGGRANLLNPRDIWQFIVP